MADNYTRRINIWVNGQQVKNEISSVKQAMLKLIAEQSRMTIGSKEYLLHTQKIKTLKGIIDQHNADLKGVATGWARLKTLSSTINKYFLMFSTAVAGFGSLLIFGKRAISVFAEFDDKVADVARTTGMAKEQVYQMNESLKKLDTRTGQKQLMDLAEIGGKLGVAQEDIEGFVKAADKINVALGSALGGNVEDTINSIGKLVDIFHIKETEGIEQGLLKVGSAINSLGLASTAQESYIVDFTKRIGGIAPQAGISITKVMGLAATLDMLGQTSETASTAVTGVYTGMFKKTAEYANIAGLSIKEFSQLLRKDANEAFLKVLEGLNGNNAGMERLVTLMDGLGLDGKRSIQVLGVLSNNIESVRTQQDLANKAYTEGTSILEAFNLKNTSAQARLDKAKRSLENMTIELGQKLLPVLTTSTNMFTYFVKYVGIATDLVIKHAWGIKNLVAALIVYVTWEKLKTIHISKNLFLGNLQAIAIRLQIALTNQATFAQKRALVAQEAMNAAVKFNPWGLLAAAVGFAVGALIQYVQKLSEASSIEKSRNAIKERTNELLSDELSKVQLLTSYINSENISMARKKEAIEELKKIVPGYNAMLNDQGRIIFQNTKAIEDYIKQLRKQYYLEAAKEEYQSEIKKELAAQRKVDEAQMKYDKLPGNEEKPGYVSVGGALVKTAGNAKYGAGEELRSAQKELKKVQIVTDDIEKTVLGAQVAVDEKAIEYQKEVMRNIYKFNDLVKQTTDPQQKKAFNEALNYYSSEWLRITGQVNAPANGGYGGNFTPGTTGSGTSKADDKYKHDLDLQKANTDARIAAMKEGYDKEAAEIKKKYDEQREIIKHELDTNKELTADQIKALGDRKRDLSIAEQRDYDELAKKWDLKELQDQEEYLNTKLAAVKEGSLAELKLKLDLLENQRQAEILKAEGNEKDILAINEKYRKLKADATEKHALSYVDDQFKASTTKMLQAQEQELNELNTLYARGEINLKEFKRRKLDIDNKYALESLRIALKKAEDELAILQASGEDTIEAMKQIAEIKKQIEEGSYKPGTTGNSGEKGFSDMSNGEIANYTIQQAQTVADAIYSIKQNSLQAEYDLQLSMLDKARDKELSSKHLTEKKKAQIQEKYEAQRRKILQEQWKKQHAADIIMSIIKTALAVVNQLSGGDPVSAAPRAIAAGIAGAAETAVIASQKMPEFYTGGYTSTGTYKKQVAGVTHVNEYVVPEEGTKNSNVRRILDVFETARQNKSLSRLDMNSIMNAVSTRGFSIGGYSSTSTGNNMFNDIAPVPQKNNQENETQALLLSILNKLDKRLNEPIDATVALRGRKGLYEVMEEDDTLRNNAKF